MGVTPAQGKKPERGFKVMFLSWSRHALVLVLISTTALQMTTRPIQKMSRLHRDQEILNNLH